MTVKVTAEELYKRKITIRLVKIGVAAMLVLLSLLYLVLYVVNTGGHFTVNLDPNLRSRRNVIMSPYSDFRETHLSFQIDALEYMDNISGNWIPDDITEHEGNHSRDHYLAFSFFLRNDGDEPVDYVREILINSVIKNVDQAIRVKVFLNRDPTIYAKRNTTTREPEPNTTPFESAFIVMSEERRDFKPGEVDKYTIVIWLEGDDPDCIDDIIGGAMSLTMLIRELK